MGGMDKERFLMGSETEYGAIALDEPPPISLGTLIAFLKILKEETGGFSPSPDGFDRWTRLEPHQFPGKSVKRLFSFLENKRAERKLMAWEGVSAGDKFLYELGVTTPDGGRAYLDLNHLEYSSPECADPYQLIGCERNFSAAITGAVGRFREETGKRIFFFRNNSDGKGNSYSHHLNFCVSRGLFEKIVCRRGFFSGAAPEAAVWASFLATSVIFAGTGKLGAENGGEPCDFQISQRADFFRMLYGTHTNANRPLINQRDEPLANQSKYGRLHVIFDDTPMADATLFLSAGTKALVLKMLESRKEAKKMPTLEDPLRDLGVISRDLSCRKELVLANGKRMAAVDIQSIVCGLAREFFRDAEKPWISDLLDLWEKVLGDLKTDPLSLSGALDWPAKLALLQKSGHGFRDKRAREIDLLYHSIDSRRSVFSDLRKNGGIRELIKEPGGFSLIGETRAFWRGTLVREKKDLLYDISWETVAFQNSDEVFLMDPFDGSESDHRPPQGG